MLNLRAVMVFLEVLELADSIMDDRLFSWSETGKSPQTFDLGVERGALQIGPEILSAEVRWYQGYLASVLAAVLRILLAKVGVKLIHLINMNPFVHKTASLQNRRKRIAPCYGPHAVFTTHDPPRLHRWRLTRLFRRSLWALALLD
jgi:hypothetical protein